MTIMAIDIIGIFFWLKLFFNDYNRLLKNVQISIWILDED